MPVIKLHESIAIFFGGFVLFSCAFCGPLFDFDRRRPAHSIQTLCFRAKRNRWWNYKLHLF